MTWVTTFGRFNPPHKGHLKAMDYADKSPQSIGDKAPADQRFYASKSNDPKKNPLDYGFKMKQLQKMFPQHSKKWDTDENVRTVLDAAKKGHQAGYKNFHFVGGGDRRQGMEDLLRRYNGDLYQFDNIYSHSAGERDESKSGDDPIAQLSASGQRKFAMDGDFDGFKGGLDLRMDIQKRTPVNSFMYCATSWGKRTKSMLITEATRQIYMRYTAQGSCFIEEIWWNL